MCDIFATGDKIRSPLLAGYRNIVHVFALCSPLPLLSPLSFLMRPLSSVKKITNKPPIINHQDFRQLTESSIKVTENCFLPIKPTCTQKPQPTQPSKNG